MPKCALFVGSWLFHHLFGAYVRVHVNVYHSRMCFRALGDDVFVNPLVGIGVLLMIVMVHVAFIVAHIDFLMIYVA